MLRFSAHLRTAKEWARQSYTFLLRPKVLVWFPLVALIQNDVITFMNVSGRSMSPTLNPDAHRMNDVIVIDKWHTLPGNKWKRGEVVVLRSPTTDRLIIKRIIALEGDKVSTLPPYPDPVVTIPEGHVWVEGDEPFHTLDSNSFGPVSLGLVHSKAPWIVLPFSRWGPVPPAPRWKWIQSRVKRRREYGLEELRQAVEASMLETKRE
ncbi:LexA/Signal peptidase [Clavulina sp. PMI_390]|nr:LexA/Signal peptidase [Clavulina sp. PMI_390]